MMGDFLDDDDDCSDLYADVEVQATSAITSAASSAKPYSAPEQQINEQDDEGSNADNVVASSGGGSFSTGPNPANKSVGCEVSRKSEGGEGSESEDDGLNIFLNEEDGDPIPHTPIRSCDGGFEAADEGLVGSGLDTGGDGSWLGNGLQRSYSLQHPQYKEKRLYPSTFPKENESSSVPSHSIQDNNRTILDVNIDTFEEKRWRYPGANMSAFFNFGFDEDSWRQYSNSTSMPKGRAIEVEDSGTERLPTMDQSCPENWESDVVIQIKVQEFEENSCASVKVDLSDKSNGDKASKSCELSTDDVGEASHSIGPNGGQMSMGSAEGNRSSHSKLETNKFSPHHDNSERDQVSDSDEHQPCRDQAKTAKVIQSVGCERDSKNELERNMSKSYHDNCETEQIDEHHPGRNRAKTAVITEPVGRERDSKNEFERNVSKTDQHRSNNSVSLLDDKSHLSLTLSCSESETEPSGESCHGVYRRSSLGTELRDSGTSGHNCCRSNGREQADSGQKCTADKSLSEERRWSEEESYQRVSEHQKCQDEHDEQSTKRRLIGGCRQIKSQHDLDLPKRKDSSYFRARDFPLGDGGQRRAGRYVEADNGRHTQNRFFRYQHSIDVDCNYGGEEISPYVSVPPMFPRKHSFGRERQVPRRKSEKLQLGKRSHDDLVFDSVVDLPRHRYDSMDEKYESHSPTMWREINTRERVLRHDGDAMHVDRPWREEEEEMLREHWNDYQRDWNHDQDPHFKSRWRDSKIPARYGKYEPMLMENHSRLSEGIYDDPGTYDDDFAGNYVHGTNSKDDYMDFDDQHQITKRRHVWRSRFHQAEEPISAPGGNLSVFDRTSCYRRTIRQDNTNARYKYEESGMTNADILLEEHGYETIREEYRDNLVNRSLMYRCEREKMVRTYVNDPVELGFGEMKPPGIHSAHGSLPSLGRSRKQFLKQDGPKIQKLSTAPFSGKANRRHKLAGKLPPATEYKNESDIEEGQITEETMTRVPQSNTNKTEAPQNANAAPCDAAVNKAYDEQWLQDRLAKMEKRRERFKEATEKVITDHIPSTQLQAVTLVNSSVETKQERPSRKRRWV